jgi:peptidoglycan/xylan/chitin deacetylase (PgdA/CDA1 family)
LVIRRAIPTLACLPWIAAAISFAHAGECANPKALGTSRVLQLDAKAYARLGTMQYSDTLPLDDKEVVITFDDGPLPPYSTRVLDILAAECVKATYFLVGRMARQFPDLVRRIAAEGHTIGTHSENHPLNFHRALPEKVAQEVTAGITSTQAALGEAATLAPFFRVPGLLRTHDVETYLASQGLVTWSADFPADDWKRINASEVLHRAISRIEAKRKGILLLHDIQPATVLALPGLLKEFKARGYRIVHVVPSESGGPTRPLDPLPMPVAGRKAGPASDLASTGNAGTSARLDPPRLSWPRVLPASPSAVLETANAASLAIDEASHRSAGSMFLDLEADSRITGWHTTEGNPSGWYISTLAHRVAAPKPKAVRKSPVSATAQRPLPNRAPPRTLAPKPQPQPIVMQEPVVPPPRGGLLSRLFEGSN